MLRQLYKELDKETRDSLKMAHDHSVPQYVKLPGGKFIGVHLNGMRHLKVEEVINDWYYGTILIINPGGNTDVNKPC